MESCGIGLCSSSFYSLSFLLILLAGVAIVARDRCGLYTEEQGSACWQNDSEMVENISTAAALEREVKSVSNMSQGHRNLNLWSKEPTAHCVEFWVRFNGNNAVVAKDIKSKVQLECLVHEMGILWQI